MLRFAAISQTEINKNMEEFNKGIDPSITLAVYMRKQDLCQDMANNVKISITKAIMVPIETKHAVATGDI